MRLRKASSFPHSHRRTPLCHVALRGSPPELHLPVLLTEVVSSRLTLRLQRESPSRTERPEIRREQSRASTVFSGFFRLSSVSSGYKKGAGFKCPFLAERGERPPKHNGVGDRTVAAADSAGEVRRKCAETTPKVRRQRAVGSGKVGRTNPVGEAKRSGIGAASSRVRGALSSKAGKQAKVQRNLLSRHHLRRSCCPIRVSAMMLAPGRARMRCA